MAREVLGWLAICAFDTLGETGAWRSRVHRYALVPCTLSPTDFPLSEPGCKTIPLRSRVTSETFGEKMGHLSA